MAQLQQLPPDGDEILALVEGFVAQMAARHTPRLDTRGGKFVVDFGNVDVLGTPLGPFGVLCWALPEAMTDRLMQEVAGQIGISTGTGTLSAEKRKELAQQCTDAMDTSQPAGAACAVGGLWARFGAGVGAGPAKRTGGRLEAP
jgi:hypothetical protein